MRWIVSYILSAAFIFTFPFVSEFECVTVGQSLDNLGSTQKR